MANQDELGGQIITGALRRAFTIAAAPVNGAAGTLVNVAEPGDLLIRTDAGNVKLYQNTNTKASPTWTEKAASGASLGATGEMAAAGTSTANNAGVAATAAPIDHVHALGTHDHSDATKGATLGPTAFAAGAFTADAAGRAPFAASFVNSDLIAALAITNGKLAVGVLSADATGRALMAANFFDAATAAAKFADSSIPGAKVNFSFGVAPTAIAPDDSAAEGTSGSVARADHRHAITCAAPDATNSFGAAAAEGAAATFLRSDAVFLARLANAQYFLGRNAANGANVNGWRISANDLFQVGTASFEVATANLTTFTVTNPGAPRTITFGDPGGADSVAYLAAAQTLTNKTLTAPAITGGTAIELTGLSIRSTGAAFDRLIATADVLTADRALNLALGDAARTLTMTGDLAMSGAFGLTLTLTAATGVTLPTTGTLATLAGAEALTNKTITAMAGAMNMADQALQGSAAANGDLTLTATSHATKTTSYIVAQQMLDGTADSLAVKVVAGAVGDGNFTATPLNGLLAIDSTNFRLYFRYGAAWHYVAQTAGVQIPAGETVCPKSGKQMKIGDEVICVVDKVLEDGALHAVWMLRNP
ncbi:MAG: hypothetical protein AAB368_03405 [bacterium]